ncbi:diadenylate cyclase CdaA [bacterium]|nr:diadenylate cyclase CdaA [bacterium]
MDLNFIIFHIGFLPVGLVDILDILLISFILYKVYFVMRRTRAIQMFIGLMIIFVISFITQALHMQGVSWIFSSLHTVWIIAFVILFQPELRRILTVMGQSRIIRYFTREQRSEVMNEVVRGTVELSRRGYGGLIVMVRDTGIKTVVETGVPIQSLVSSSLMVSIFNPRSPLHDGAIIIQNDTIGAAKCILPLSKNPGLERRLGTRHRAAIGLTEESDALVVVVSEESGAISIAENGEMVRGLDFETLQAALDSGMKFGGLRRSHNS